MNAILTTQVNDNTHSAMLSLPISQKPFILAVMSSRILEIEKFKAGDFIRKNLKAAEFTSGLTKVHDDDMLILTKSTFDLIESNYRNLTTGEFEIICKNGSLGIYGDWFGMCLKSVNFWISSFFKLEDRKKAIVEFNKKLNEEEQRTSDKPLHLKVEFSKESAIKAFNHFKNYNEMPMASFAYYDVINDLLGVDYNGVKTLVFDKDIRKKIVKECTELHEKMCLHQKNKLEKIGFINEAENLVNVIIDPKGSKTLERLIKERFLKHFFNELINQNKKLEF